MQKKSPAPSFSPSVVRVPKVDQALEARLLNALNDLYMVYQPIVSSDGATFGFEALVRSSEPTLTLPDKLFSEAERLDKTHVLGQMVRSLVARDVARAPERSLIFVNLHASDLSDPELYSSSAPLSLHASRVVVELTERHSLEQFSDLTERIARLRKLGYGIAIDDLGAGYASLSCINDVQPDIVKLDMSLVRGIDRSLCKLTLVRSIIGACQAELGIQVVCEGVETSAERETLLGAGANLMQGYLFGRPERLFVSAPSEVSNHVG